MIGGALGAVLRLLVKNTPIWNYFGNIPLNTLLINITGCFLLAFFLVVALEIIDVAKADLVRQQEQRNTFLDKMLGR